MFSQQGVLFPEERLEISWDAQMRESENLAKRMVFAKLAVADYLLSEIRKILV